MTGLLEMLMSRAISAPLRHWKLIVAIPLFASTATYGALKIVPSSYKSTVEILIFDPQRQIDAAVQKTDLALHRCR